MRCNWRLRLCFLRCAVGAQTPWQRALLYVTLRHKLIALGHFWRFVAEQHPDITRSADVLPAHGRAYIPYAIAQARERQRGDDTGPDPRNTAHVWLLEVCTFFTDLCTWATEPDSPFGRMRRVLSR